MSTKFLHASLVITAILTSFLVSQTKFISTDITIAVASIIFLIGRLLGKIGAHRTFDATIITFVVTLVVNSTGGAGSPLFFLLYFLVFALSLLLEPFIAVTSSLALTVAYIFFTSVTDFVQAVPLLAFPFLVPFALFLGDEYTRVRKLEAFNRTLQNKIHSEEQIYRDVLVTVQRQLEDLEKNINSFEGDHHRQTLSRRVAELQRLIVSHEKIHE
jgi:hypothetical protein